MLPKSPLRNPQRVGSLSILIFPSYHQGQTGSSISIPSKRRIIQTFWDSTTTIGSSQVTPSHLGNWIPKSNKYNRDRRGREWSALAWIKWLTQSGARIFSQEQIQGLDFRERGRGAQDLDLKGSSAFYEWPTTQGGMWGTIYSPHLKKSRWEEFSPD
jgi:hypothetical protein